MSTEAKLDEGLKKDSEESAGGESGDSDWDAESSDLPDSDEDQSDYSDDDATARAKLPDEVDSSDEEDLRNTIGNIPVSWYNDQSHIGYDLEGKSIKKPEKRGEIDELLAKMEDPDYWRKVRDRQTGDEVRLTDEQVATVSNIRGAAYPQVGYNPYERVQRITRLSFVHNGMRWTRSKTKECGRVKQPFIDFFTSETMIHPISNQPDHKRSFIPSKLDKLKVGKMVHAIKMGWAKPKKEKKSDDDERLFYDLWKSEEKDELSRNERARVRMQLPAPKMPLPDHSESYNPPAEYLLDDEERDKWENAEAEERKRDFLPQKFSSMREVPAYPQFVKDRFERCLDLYLAPRQRKMKLNVDPKDLLPDLPKPSELQPFPATMALSWEAHKGLVRCVAMEPLVGQFLASAGDDKMIKLWELPSGRLHSSLLVSDTVHCLAWIPSAANLPLLSAAVGCSVLLFNVQVGDKLLVADADLMMKGLAEKLHENPPDLNSKPSWKFADTDNIHVEINHEEAVKQVTWHVKGDYFASVCPKAGAQSVFVHQLSKLRSQCPFSKNKGAVQCALFHPSKPIFFVATQRHIRIYDIAKQQFLKKLYPNCRWISCMQIHPKGDNLIVGSYDCKLSWFDLDLSAKPYKVLKHHRGAIRSLNFHPKLPLFASVADDCKAIVCHGRVYSDLLQNALIVPVKMLGGHKPKDNLGVLGCCFHPWQPWLMTCGADGTIKLYIY